MKRIYYIAFLALVLTLGSFISSDLCEGLMFTKGATLEMENYSQGKKAGVIRQVVKDVKSTGDKKEAIVHVENFDTGNNKDFDGDVTYVCDGSKVMIDAQSIIRSIKQPGMENLNMQIEQGYFEYPLNPSAGQTLPDMKFSIKMSDKASGQEIGTMKMIFENRKIEGKENVTTPAGTFSCWKVKADTRMELNMMGMNRNEPTGQNINYYNKEMGSVKSEIIGKGGKVGGYTILSKYSK